MGWITAIVAIFLTIIFFMWIVEPFVSGPNVFTIGAAKQEYCENLHGLWNGDCFIKQNNGSYKKINLQFIQGEVVEVVEWRSG